MKTFLGETGLKATWQKPHKKVVKCHKCGGKARIMFVAFEENEEDYVCQLHKNEAEVGYWPHDAIACAVYLCKDCFEPVAIINQA